jgi:hypothetical protein
MSDAAEGLRWVVIGPANVGPPLPAWMRSAALAADGTVFLPGAISGNEVRACRSATWDGVPIVEVDGHIYLPAGWLAVEYPGEADVCRMIEGRVRGHFGAEGGPTP